MGASTGTVRRWRINGWPAQILLWTAEEWASLPAAERPADAVAYPCGVRLALRLGD